MFFYYANLISDDVVLFATKEISRNIETVFLKLGTINVHQKRNKIAPLVLFP